jgi:hypothetical protein
MCHLFISNFMFAEVTRDDCQGDGAANDEHKEALWRCYIMSTLWNGYQQNRRLQHNALWQLSPVLLLPLRQGLLSVCAFHVDHF